MTLPDTKVCVTCETEQPISEYLGTARSGEPRVYYYCKTCRLARWRYDNKTRTADGYYKRRYQRHKEKIDARTKARYTEGAKRFDEYMRGKVCVDCGFSDTRALEFDHVRGKKEFNIARLRSMYTWDRIEAEIAKCDIRCANCHRIRHAEEREAKKKEEQCSQNTCPPTVSSPSSRPN